jgi:predicted glycosyltransferase
MSSALPRVDIVLYVQNLLGIGHLARVAAIAEAAADFGLKVAIVCGGVRPSGYAPRGALYVQLPAVQAVDASCKVLIDTATGAEIDEAFLAARRALLETALDQLQPKVFITEMFPFGRWRFRKELLPILEKLHGRVKLAVSVRDIINQGSVTGARAEAVAALINQRYDAVFVHGDPLFLPLEQTYPQTPQIAGKLIYTGYVQPPARFTNEALPTLPAQKGYVLVSAGGGLYGAALYRAALAAKPLSRFANYPWLFVLGPYCPADVAIEIRSKADTTTHILDNHPQLGALFPNAAASLSQAGCNTVLELLQAQIPAVVVPFAEGKESEQGERARVLARLKLLTCLESEALTPENLAAALDGAQPPQEMPEEIHCHGAEVTALHLQRWVKG